MPPLRPKPRDGAVAYSVCRRTMMTEGKPAYLIAD